MRPRQINLRHQGEVFLLDRFDPAHEHMSHPKARDEIQKKRGGYKKREGGQLMSYCHRKRNTQEYQKCNLIWATKNLSYEKTCYREGSPNNTSSLQYAYVTLEYLRCQVHTSSSTLYSECICDHDKEVFIITCLASPSSRSALHLLRRIGIARCPPKPVARMLSS